MILPDPIYLDIKILQRNAGHNGRLGTAVRAAQLRKREAAWRIAGRFRELLEQLVGPRHEPQDIDPVGRSIGVPGNPIAATRHDRHGAGRVAAHRVRQRHRQLRQPLPEVPLLSRRRFPGSLQHLMRVKGSAAVEPPLCLDERLSRRQRQAFRDASDAFSIVPQRSPQAVSRPGALGATCRIAVPIAAGRLTHSASPTPLRCGHVPRSDRSSHFMTPA